MTLVAVLAAAYPLAALHARRPLGWRVTAWWGGCAAVGAALLLPASGDPRVHMVEHLALGMLAPIGFVLAAPVTLLLAAAPARWRRHLATALRSRPVRVLGHPATAGVIAVGGTYAVLLTPLYAAAGREPPLHHAVHVHYVAAGCLFAWAVLGLEAAVRVPMRTRVAALLLAAAAHAFLAKYLYARAGTLPPGAAGDADAWRAAAKLMYYGGDAAELLLAVALFTIWYRRAARWPCAAAGPAPRS